MLTGRDIVYISSIEWTFLWQVHQEIALRLARAGNRVLYIENMGVRSPGLKDASRIVSRLKHWAGSFMSRGVREVAPNLYVCSPLVMPPFGSSIRRRMNRHFLLPAIGRTARRLGMRDVLVWTYLPTDSAVDLVKLFWNSRGASIYHCLADFPALSATPDELTQSEKDLAQLSDQVFTNCSRLSERLFQWNDNASRRMSLSNSGFVLEIRFNSTVQSMPRSRVPSSAMSAAFTGMSISICSPRWPTRVRTGPGC